MEEKKPDGTPLVLWSAFSMSPLIIGVVSHFLVPPEMGFPIPIPDCSNPLVVTLTAVAVLGVIGSLAASKMKGTALQRLIFRMAFAESAAIAGFIVTLLTQTPGAWVPYVFGSWCAMALAFPRHEVG